MNDPKSVLEAAEAENQRRKAAAGEAERRREDEAKRAPPPERLEVILGDRATGKTTELLKWVLAGERCYGYPGWTRVLVVGSVAEEIALRPWAAELAKELHGLEWSEIDWAHRVFHWDDWVGTAGLGRGAGRHPLTHVRVDGIERFLPRIPGIVTGFSINTEVEVTDLGGALPDPPLGPQLRVDWRARRATVVLTFEGDEAKEVLDAAGNDLPGFAKNATLEIVRAANEARKSE